MKNGVRDAGSGVREGVGLMADDYIWEITIDNVENPVQVKTFKAPRAWGADREAD
jgi:hypothetical protein